MSSLRYFLALLLPALSLIACGSRSDTAPDPAGKRLELSTAANTPSLPVVPVSGEPRLKHGARTPEELVSTVLRAFSTGDTVALTDVLIDEREWKEYLYPEFSLHYPAAKDMRREVKEYLWQNHAMGSAKSLLKGLAKLGGRTLRLESISYDDTLQRFASYQIHQGTVAGVVDAKGERSEITSLGSIVEMDGVYKLLSYRDRE